MKKYSYLGVIIGLVFLVGCFDGKNLDNQKPVSEPVLGSASESSTESLKEPITDTDKQWPLYENSRYQFSVKYPFGWKLEPAPQNNDGRGFSSPDEEIYCYAYGFYNALISEAGNPQTLEEYTTWLTEQPGQELIQEQDTEMAGHPAKEILFGQDGKVEQAVYILGKESGRGLYCTFDNLKQQEQFRENFKIMKESFQVNFSLDG